MEEVRQKLTPDQKARLRSLWEDKDTLHALGEALSQHQLILAQQSLRDATDFNQVIHLRGQDYNATWLFSFLKANYKALKEADQAKKAHVESDYSQ